MKLVLALIVLLVAAAVACFSGSGRLEQQRVSEAEAAMAHGEVVGFECAPFGVPSLAEEVLYYAGAGLLLLAVIATFVAANAALEWGPRLRAHLDLPEQGNTALGLTPRPRHDRR